MHAARGPARAIRSPRRAPHPSVAFARGNPPDRPPLEPADENRLIAERRQKLDELRKAGVEPFPASFPDHTPVADVLARYKDLESGEETVDVYRLAGRLSARRGHGKAAFLDLVDRT